MEHNDEISDLLRDAESPRERAHLLVLMQMSQSLASIANAFDSHRSQFEQHKNEFDSHAKKFAAQNNKLSGAWMATSIVLSFVLTLAGWYFAHHVVAVNEAQQTQRIRYDASAH